MFSAKDVCTKGRAHSKRQLYNRVGVQRGPSQKKYELKPPVHHHPLVFYRSVDEGKNGATLYNSFYDMMYPYTVVCCLRTVAGTTDLAFMPPKERADLDLFVRVLAEHARRYSKALFPSELATVVRCLAVLQYKHEETDGVLRALHKQFPTQSTLLDLLTSTAENIRLFVVQSVLTKFLF
eukprot:gene16134-22280_t